MQPGSSSALKTVQGRSLWTKIFNHVFLRIPLYIFLTLSIIVSLLWRPSPQTPTQTGQEVAEYDAILNGYECKHSYSIEILSVEPMIIYLNDFISDTEIDHLTHTYSVNYTTSRIWGEDFQAKVDSEVRLSKSSIIPTDDPVSQCLKSRMKRLLGNMQHMEVEDLQLLRYDPGGRFLPHYDWFQTPPRNTENGRAVGSSNRLGTIFAYLDDACVGGETYFPNIRGVSQDADGNKFSRTDTGEGLLIRPQKRNAIFWNNLYINGSGDVRVLHAGLPVQSGTKTGLNMFSTYLLDRPLIG